MRLGLISTKVRNFTPLKLSPSKYQYVMVGLLIVLITRALGFFITPEFILNFLIAPLTAAVFTIIPNAREAGIIIAMFASGIIVLVLDFLLTVSLAYIASRKLFSMDIKNATIKIVFTAYLLSFFVPSITPVSQTQFGNNFLNNDASKIVMTHTESYVQNESNQAEDPYKAGVLTLELTVKNNLDYPIKLRDVRSESMHCSSSEDVNIYNLTLLAGESHNFALLCNVDNMKAMQEESHKSFSYEPIYTRLFLSLSLDTLVNSKSLSNSQPATINFVFEPGLQGEYIKYIEKSIQTKAYNWFK